MLKGTYIYYQDGKEIYRSSNVITKFGKRFLTNVLADKQNFNSKSMAFGIDSTTATDSNTRLGFEFYRVPISFGSTDIQTIDGVTTYSIVYKATIPQDVSGIISEVGIYPELRSSLSNYDSKIILDFESQLDWSGDPNISIDGAKVGNSVLTMSSDSTLAKEYKTNISELDLSGYSVNDTIRLAYYKNNNNLQNIILKFYNAPTKYYSVTITPESGTGHKVTSDISFATILSSSVGSPDASAINQIGITITPTTSQTTSVGMDALRINDEDTFDPTFGLISRSILSSVLNKQAGRQVDVEYRLDLGF